MRTSCRPLAALVATALAPSNGVAGEPAMSAIADTPPRFVADPELGGATAGRIALAAWYAGIACTHVVPAHAPVVTIRASRDPDGFAGRAYATRSGLTTIAIDPGIEDPFSALPHEVAHAWFHDGPASLVEGQADLLAGCMASEAPGLLPWVRDHGQDSRHAASLRGWANSPGDHVRRSSGYLQAYRLMRAVQIVDPAVLESGALPFESWADLDLWAVGMGADALTDLLDAPRRDQVRLLADRDADGLPAVVEQVRGTDPDRWDTDGDGFPDILDGRALPAGAVVVDPGHWICASAGDGSGEIPRGAIHGAGPVAWYGAGSRSWQILVLDPEPAGEEVGVGVPPLPSGHLGAVAWGGPAWFVPGDLGPSEVSCAYGPGGTIVIGHPGLGDAAAAVSRALAPAQDRVAVALRQPPRRADLFFVAEEAPHRRVEPAAMALDVIGLPLGWVDAVTPEDLALLGAVAAQLGPLCDARTESLLAIAERLRDAGAAPLALSKGDPEVAPADLRRWYLHSCPHRRPGPSVRAPDR